MVVGRGNKREGDWDSRAGISTARENGRNQDGKLKEGLVEGESERREMGE